MSRDVDPHRGHGPYIGEKRRRLVEECERLKADLRRLDDELEELARQRQAVATKLKERHRALWPNLARRGRRALPNGRRALPPIAPNAVGLWGRRLRAACRDILSVGKRPLTLTELHAMLHRRGYFIDCTHEVKALADAMRYDVAEGRLRRIDRGVYSLIR